MSCLTRAVCFVCVVVAPAICFAQGTLRVTFDGPPDQPPGSDFLVQSYFESGISFQPVAGTDGFGRCWSGQQAGIPDEGTPYIVTGAGESLAFSFTDNSLFGLDSVDLAGFSIGAPDYTVNFVGYHANGSTITTSFSGSSINFQTHNFGSDWSSGLTRVEIPNYGWSLDNLVVTVPEPSTGVLMALGALTFSIWRSRRRNSR